MQEYIEYIISPFVDDPSEVDITVQEDEQQTQIIIHAPSKYMGLLIGKQGRTVSALRQLCKLYGNLNQQNILLRVEEKGS